MIFLYFGKVIHDFYDECSDRQKQYVNILKSYDIRNFYSK